MMFRRGWALALGAVAITAMGLSLVKTRTNTPSGDGFAITAEPVGAPVANTPDTPTGPGALALPAPHETTTVKRPVPLTPQLPIDYVEPWTGEDLKPAILAARKDRRGFDRTDPWNPNIQHDTPTPTRQLTDEDPWDEVAALEKARPVTAKIALEKSSPWDTTL